MLSTQHTHTTPSCSAPECIEPAWHAHVLIVRSWQARFLTCRLCTSHRWQQKRASAARRLSDRSCCPYPK